MGKQMNSWFKFYPRDWLEDTRAMTLEHRGAYIDCIAIIMDTDKAIPDDIKWLAHKLHVSTRKARAIREVLVEAQKLVKTNSGFDNEKCREVRMNRKNVSKINSENARKKKAKNIQSNDEPSVLKSEPTLNQGRTSAEPNLSREDKTSENSENTNKNNDANENSQTERCYTRAGGDKDIDKDKKETTEVVSKKSMRLPDNWRPDQSLINWALQSLCLEEGQVNFETDKFCDYWHALTGSKSTKLDWGLTWKNWLRRAHEEAVKRKENIKLADSRRSGKSKVSSVSVSPERAKELREKYKAPPPIISEDAR